MRLRSRLEGRPAPDSEHVNHTASPLTPAAPRSPARAAADLFEEASAIEQRVTKFRRRIAAAEDMLPNVEQKCNTSLAKFHWEGERAA